MITGDNDSGIDGENIYSDGCSLNAPISPLIDKPEDSFLWFASLSEAERTNAVHQMMTDIIERIKFKKRQMHVTFEETDDKIKVLKIQNKQDEFKNC